MTTVLLVIHLMIAVALVALVLMQRSEGGALGIGGGGDGFMSGRGASNLLTRSTAILAAVFFVTSLLLAMLGGVRSTPTQIAPSKATEQGADKKAPNSGSNLPKLAPLAPKPNAGEKPAAAKPDAAKSEAAKPDTAKPEQSSDTQRPRPQ
ncbi:MAG: preprotein translocase subunit SecG [Alphaproteobacteria bacterium]